MVVGYGLTESTATVSCTLPVGYDIGSVGVVLPGIEVKSVKTMKSCFGVRRSQKAITKSGSHSCRY